MRLACLITCLCVATPAADVYAGNRGPILAAISGGQLYCVKIDGINKVNGCYNGLILRATVTAQGVKMPEKPERLRIDLGHPALTKGLPFSWRIKNGALWANSQSGSESVTRDELGELFLSDENDPDRRQKFRA